MFEEEIFYECSICGLVHFDHLRWSNCCSEYKNSSSDPYSYSEGDSGSSDCGGGCD